MSADEGLFDNEKLGYPVISAGSIIRGDRGETYEAVRNLGCGVNSTVWVGRNCSEQQFSLTNPKYVALKILNEDATREHLGEDEEEDTESERISANELQMLWRTYSGLEPKHRPQVPSYKARGMRGPPHPGWRRVSGFLGSFTCKLDNKNHLVIISPLYGEHMSDYMLGEPDNRMSLPFVNRVAKQTLTALDYLHSQCGIIHCDVKPENILRDFNVGPQIDDIFEAILKHEPNAGRDGRAAALWLPHDKRSEYFYVVLADLSHASWNDLITRSPRAIGSPALKAPELVLGFAYSTKIDIWAFGCTIFELLTGKSLFSFSDSRSPNELAAEPKYHLSLMQNLLDEPLLPRASRGTITVEEGFIDTEGSSCSFPPPLTFSSTEFEIGCIKQLEKSASLEEQIAKDVPSDMEDKDKFAVFLRRCLRLDPSKRASASELLSDPWLAED
ncbi:hypothetical protein ACEPAG_2241 [Sanghuangporus baumii]